METRPRADVARVVDLHGRYVSTLRIWHGPVAYITRGTVERHLCAASGKTLRAAMVASLADDAAMSALGRDFDMGCHLHVVGATKEELSYLKVAELVGARSSTAQLVSLVLAAAVCHTMASPAATIDALLGAAFAGPPEGALSPSAARERLAAVSLVTPMPATLPEPLSALPDGPYAISPDRLREQFAAFAAWAQADIRLDRAGMPVADATKNNSVAAARMVLGFAVRVAGREGEPDLLWLLDGTLTASYISWASTTRKKQPSSLSLEASSLVRVLDFLSATMPRLEGVDQLKTSLRRLAAQLSAMHRPVTSIAELEAAGKWADFALVQDKVAAEAEDVLRTAGDDAKRTPSLARRVHDALLCGLVILDCAPNRPGCLRVLKMPGAAAACECSTGGCQGNRFVDTTMVLTHTKTSRSRDAIRVDFGGTRTERLLRHHAAWGRGLLGPAEDGSVWVALRGGAFRSEEAFSSYLPRVLARLKLPHLTFTTLRHAAVVAAAEWASREELEGMARSIGTSVRKVQEVYDYRMVERSSGRFLTAFRERTTAEAGEGEPCMPVRALDDEAAPLPSLLVPIPARHVACAVDDSLTFAEFLESRQKRPSVCGPGRSAAPVKRRLSRHQATTALRGGLAAQRAAYAFAYGYETTSGKLAWLRRKVEEAVASD